MRGRRQYKRHGLVNPGPKTVLLISEFWLLLSGPRRYTQSLPKSESQLPVCIAEAGSGPQAATQRVREAQKKLQPPASAHKLKTVLDLLFRYWSFGSKAHSLVKGGGPLGLSALPIKVATLQPVTLTLGCRIVGACECAR